MTHQDLASRLNETHKKCTLVGQEMVLVPLCLRQRALSLVETMLNADVMDSSAQRKLGKDSAGNARAARKGAVATVLATNHCSVGLSAEKP